MSPHPRVLIVDASRESRDILKTLLHRQGAETLEARNAKTATELTKDRNPDVIVLDEESTQGLSTEAKEGLGQTASRSSIPIVVLGTARRQISPFPTGELVTKPYHYGQLLRKIEDILAE